MFTYLLSVSIISTDILNVFFLYHSDILIILFYFSIFIYLSDLFMLNLRYQTIPQSDICGNTHCVCNTEVLIIIISMFNVMFLCRHSAQFVATLN